MSLAVDGMAARARRLAESEAEQHERERRARAEWNTLAARSAALGRPVPDDALGHFSELLAAHARAVELRREAVGALEATLADWRNRLDRVEDEDRALARLRARLHRTLADEVGELNPAELSRVVARALGDRRHTGPLSPADIDVAPAAGVEQEALLLGRLLGDDAGDARPPEAPAEREPVTDPAARALARPSTRRAPAAPEPAADPFTSVELGADFDRDSGPVDTLAGDMARPPARSSGTRSVEAARIDDYEHPDPFAALPADISADEALATLSVPRPTANDSLDEPARPLRRPRTLMHEPQTDDRLSVDIEIEIDSDADLEPDEEMLARWLGRPSNPPAAQPADPEAVEAEIDALDEADSLLEWEAAGLGQDVAMLVERRRPASSRTSVIEVVDDPFAAFDDFDDSLDAPFGFVDNVTGQGPALAGADWSLDEEVGLPVVPESEPGSEPEPEPPYAPDPSTDVESMGPGFDDLDRPAGNSFEMLLLDDPFDDSSDGDTPDPRHRSMPGGSTDPDGQRASAVEPMSASLAAAMSRVGPLETGEIDGVDMEEAFPAIRAPLGADSVDQPPLDVGAVDVRDFAAALDDAFARSGPEADTDSADDSLDADLAAAFAEDGGGNPFADQPAPEPPPAIRITDRPTAQPRPNYDPMASPPGGSLLPAPIDPGADGWGPRRLEEHAAEGPRVTEPSEPPSPEDDEDHVATDFGAALVEPAARNPFDAPQVTLPAPAPRMSGGRTSGSTDPGGLSHRLVGRPGLGLADDTYDVEANLPHRRGRSPSAHDLYDIEVALAHAAGPLRDADIDFPDDEPGDAHLTGLDWPPPKALEAFPDGSVDRSPLRPRDSAEVRLAGSLGPRAIVQLSAEGPSGDTSDVIWDLADGMRSQTSMTSATSEAEDTGDAISMGVEAAFRAVTDEGEVEPAPKPRLPRGDRVGPRAGGSWPGLVHPSVDRPLLDASDDALGAAVSDALDDALLDSADPVSLPEPLVIPSAAPPPALPDPGRDDGGWRSTPVEPSRGPARSASLADALQNARSRDALDAALDELEAPRRDEDGWATDRFAALAGALGADPWLSLDITERGEDSHDPLPDLMRRRQGRPPEPERPLPPAPAGPAPEPEEESAPRAPLGVRVGLEAGDRFFTGFSRDISVDGIFVGTQHGLKAGEEVEVFFELPGGRSINARGVVRRVSHSEGGKPSGLGIRFRQLTREARVHIGRYVARTLTGKIPLP